LLVLDIMSDEHVLDEIVTEFLLNTCRLRPKLSKYTAQAAMRCAVIASQNSQRRPNDAKAEAIPLTAGSIAEFYIEPMIPHVGDVDVMFYYSTELAIPVGHRPPTQLPDEFHNYVRVYEIVDSHLPGYVFLVLRHALTRCVDDKYNTIKFNTTAYNTSKFNTVEYDVHVYIPNHLHSGNKSCIHGPARLTVNQGCQLSHDIVYCIRCLMWPPQAADWPTRHTNYDWPNSATVDHVVSNGCDVVGVAHRQYRQHELISKLQWRMSFSRAEIVLLNSWMPVQQIVYHMLRVFMKTERLTDSADNSGAGKLSNYHIKTLMLWACEMKPKSWWTDDLNLVRICVQLLHTLGVWLTDGRCKHYFINNCNLIDNSFDVTNIGGHLMSVDKTWLSKWFVNSYIRKCFQLCPDNISWLFDVASTITKLQNAVSEIVALRLSNSLVDSWEVFNAAECIIPATLDQFPLTARSCVCWMTELAEVHLPLSAYFSSIAFLHITSRSSRYGLSDELMDILATLLGQFIRGRRYSNNFSSSLLLDTAAKLMKAVVNKSLSTVQLIEIELSKAYLYRALRCEDSDSDSIYCLANVYLAVLYYTTGQYQTAIDHCTLVTRSQDHSQCSSHVVQGELLPKIDDDIDNVLGLAVLYQHVRTAALNQHQPQHVSVFTTELFAYYLHIKCLSADMCDRFMPTSSTDKFKRYEMCISDTPQLFISDVLLFLSLSGLLKQKSQEPIIIPTEHNAPDLTELLQKYAVEHLTTFREIEAQDFGSVATIVTTDFEALYAYKRGDYQHCLQLSTQNVHTLLYGVDMTGISTFSDIIQLLDDDIVSLTALTLIVDPECRLSCSVYANITQLTLSLYMMTQCQLKLRHSVKSLAQTLEYIEVAQRRHPADRTLNQLTLKLTERKVVAYIRTLA